MSTPLFAGQSDVGWHHDENQDRWFLDCAMGLAFVSDGMGEAVTPQFVIEVLPGLLRAALPPTAALDERAATGVRSIVSELNQSVREEAPARGPITGATLVLAIVRDFKALIAHLGDSRAYLCRQGILRPLTVDHSMVQRMLREGRLTPEEVARKRSNGGPTRFLAMRGEAMADVQIIDWLPGDRLLLCSDGLPEMLTDNAIQPLMANSATPEEACRRLITAALEAGGHDNVTTVVAFAGDEATLIDEDALLP